MGHEGIILVNSPITTFQQSLTHSAIIGIAIIIIKHHRHRHHHCHFEVSPFKSTELLYNPDHEIES